MNNLKTLFRNSALIFLITLVLYCVIFILSYCFYPRDLVQGSVDTLLSGNTVFFSEHRYALLGPCAIKPDNPQKIFLIGSSNVREGLRPLELRKFFPNYEVHNLGVGGSNISQLQDIFENLVQDNLSETNWDRAIIILGIFYGNFVDNQNRFPGTYSDITKEKMRYGLCRAINGKVVSRFSQENMRLIAMALRPVLFVENQIRFLQDARDRTYAFLCKWLKEGSFDLKEIMPGKAAYPLVDEKYKKEAMEFWKGYMNPAADTLDDEQFLLLRDLFTKMLGKGARVIVVDMPLPQWHRNRSVFFKLYRERIQNYFAGVDPASFAYLDLSSSMPDNSFYDSAHPLPAATNEWAKLIAEAIKKKQWVR